MRSITRIHLSDCGWHEAYFPGTTIELADPRTGEPAHTVFSLENTGGKTSFLSLVLSCFDTNERRFLKTLIRPNQKFADYFGDLPAFILVEWDLSDGQASLLDPPRLITGQVVVPRGEGRQRELDRRFFSFRSAPDLTFDDIPAPGLKGFAENGRLNGLQDVQRWLHAVRSSHPDNFQDFSRQSDWKRKLAEEKIDTELLRAQVEFNRSEGGIEDFLNFRSESQFVRKFLAMTVPGAEADAVRGVLAEHVAKLSDLPRLERRREAIRQLKEKFAPFVDIAGKAHAAQDDVGRRSHRAASLKAALDERGDEASRRSAMLIETADEHETAAREAEAARKTARLELASATVETARRRHAQAEALASIRAQERDQAVLRERLLQAALAMRDILDDRLQSKVLLEAIDAEHADLRPRREALRGIGADFAATLGQRASEFRERQRSLTADAERLTAAAREAEAQRAAACESAQAERRAAAQIQVDLDHARDFRAALEEEHDIEPGESAEAASRRHAEAARACSAEAGELRLKAEALDRDAAAHRDRQGDLKAERSRLESEIERLSDTIREGEAKRRELAFGSTILELTGETEIDPEAAAAAAVLADARRKYADRLREDEWRQQVLHADRDSLEATGLASIDMDVRTVVDRLRESGIADTQPFALYLSNILEAPQEVHRFAESDPARFTGVAVPNRNALDRARQALESAPPLSRPITVAIAGVTAADAQDDRFVLPVNEPAAYDRAAAQDLRRRIETEMAGVASSIDTQLPRIERLETTMRELEAWRERFGSSRLKDLRQNAVDKEKRIAEIRAESEVLSERTRDADRDARDCRDLAGKRDKQGHGCTEQSRRAGDHHKQWESRVDGWRMARLAHEQSAASAEQLAERKETERDDRGREASQREREASDAASPAAAMERDAGGIAYSTSGGRATGDLDALRHSYEQALEALTALEQEKVDRLRGQHDAIKRELAKKEERFQRDFGDIPRADVETKAAGDGLHETAAAAGAILEKARESASAARADADAGARELRSEMEKCAKAVQPEPLMDLRSLEPEVLARIAPEAEATIERQEVLATREFAAARRTREQATQNHSAASECRNWADTLDDVLSGQTTPAEPVDLPHHDEIAAHVRESVAAFGRARDALAEAQKAVYGSYDEIRRFAGSDSFGELESEREVAAHLRANDPLVAADNATRTAALIDDRLKTIEHDLSRLDDDLLACVEELERLLRTALHILRRMIRDGRIPDHVPRFGGQPVFRMGADLSRISVEQRKEILRSYVTDLAESDRVPETGQDIAAELVDRMTGALGRSSLGIRLLKPKGEGDTEHMPIDRVTVSGGELLTAAMMIYLVLARLRAEAMHGGTNDGGILIMDNPLGKANKALLLKTQIGLADAMGIQLFYTTGIQDTNALAEFENIVRLRRNRQSRGTRRIPVEVEAMHAYVDKQTGDPARRPAAAAE